MQPVVNLQPNKRKEVIALLNFEAMRFSVFLYSFIFIASVASAQQELDLSWYGENDFKKDADYNQVIGEKDGFVYVLSSSALMPQNSIDVSLDVYYVGSMQLKQRIDVITNKSEMNFEEVLISQDKLLVFTSYFDRQLQLKILSLQEYDVANNTLSASERIDEMHISEKEDARPFQLSISPNANYVLIYHNNKSNNGNKVFNLKVINYDLSSLWEKEFELNYKEKMVDFREFKVDNMANVYLLSSINPFGLSKSSGLGSLVNVKSTLFIYRPAQDKMKEYEFALSRNWIDEVRLAFDENEHLIATAFYTYPNDYKIRGFVLFELDSKSGDVTLRKMVTLDKNQFKKIDQSIGRLKEYSRMLVGSPGIYPGGSSHMNSTSTEFIMKDLFVTDQTIVLAIEAFRRDERCTESFSDQQMIVDCQKNFLYGDVILFFMDRDCNLKKISHVKKMQHAINKMNPYYGFSVIGNDKGIYVLYNDDYRNIEENVKSDKRPLSNMKKAGLQIDVFSFTGSELDVNISSNDGGRTPFYPFGNMSLSDSKFLLYSQKEKNYKFGKLSVR